MITLFLLYTLYNPYDEHLSMISEWYLILMQKLLHSSIYLHN